MAIEIIFQSQSLKDEVEIQTSTSKWTFPAIQDEGSKKDLPDHTRIIFPESKCLISDFDNNKGTFQIFSEDSENITGDSLFFYGSLENVHNIHAKKSKKPTPQSPRHPSRHTTLLLLWFTRYLNIHMRGLDTYV